jgi:hypothetical protein
MIIMANKDKVFTVKMLMSQIQGLPKAVSNSLVTVTYNYPTDMASTGMIVSMKFDTDRHSSDLRKAAYRLRFLPEENTSSLTRKFNVLFVWKELNGSGHWVSDADSKTDAWFDQNYDTKYVVTIRLNQQTLTGPFIESVATLGSTAFTSDLFSIS